MSAAVRIHLEPIGGVAGDMFVAALADAFPEHREPLLELLVSLRLPLPASARLVAHRGGSLVGTRFIVRALEPAGAPSSGRGHAHDHAHGHDHVNRHGHGHGHGHGDGLDSDHLHAHVEERVDDNGHEHDRDHDHDHDHDHPHETPRPHVASPHEHGAAPPASDYPRHGHVSHAWIVDWLHGAGLGEGVRRHALGIFRLLAESEAAVHGVAADAVEFHEVGAWDSILDIVAAAFLIDALGPVRWSCAPLPLGSGTVHTAHGVMPVPAPATLHLLRGMTVVDDGLGGERVTPTGAAIVRHLVGRNGARTADAGPTTVGASGLGFGRRVLPDRPNALRCTAFVALQTPRRGAKERATGRFGEEAAGPAGDDAVDCLEFEVDDQTAEDLAVALERLRARADVLQVFQMPVFGKKGRLAARIHVVARDGAGEAVAQACFVETTTLGLRCQRLARRTLPRADVSAAGADGAPLRVKLCGRPHALTAKAEMDDVACERGGHARREQARRAAERRALGAWIADGAAHDEGADDGG